jgi:hypothetical protein
MEYQPGFDLAECARFVSTSDDMLALSGKLRGVSSPTEMVSCCKDFVALTRTLDTTLDSLSSSQTGAKADTLAASKSASKKAVHAMLKAVKVLKRQKKDGILLTYCKQVRLKIFFFSILLFSLRTHKQAELQKQAPESWRKEHRPLSVRFAKQGVIVCFVFFFVTFYCCALQFVSNYL